MSIASFAANPGRAGLVRMVRAQAGLEFKLLMRGGEQLLLTLVIPTLLLVLFTTAPIVSMPKPRVDFLVPGILALAVMSTAFTGQAIAVGFERRYGVLKRLGATALPRAGLLAGKTIAIGAVELVQAGVVIAVGFGLGWSPHGSPAAVVALLLLGTAAFSGLGLLMAGTLRAEATLAAANLVYLVLLALGGVVFPLTRFPAGMRHVLELLPITALADGLRTALRHAGTVPLHDWVVLLVWAAASLAAAAALFRWE